MKFEILFLVNIEHTRKTTMQNFSSLCLVILEKLTNEFKPETNFRPGCSTLIKESGEYDRELKQTALIK